MSVRRSMLNKATRKVVGVSLGRALTTVALHMRSKSNRLTTVQLRKKFDRSLQPATLAEMLVHIRPASFGTATADVSFIAMPHCSETVEQAVAWRGANLLSVEVKKFRSGESYVRIGETVRGRKVVIFQDFAKAENINDAIVETLLMVDAAKRASASEVVLVCPGLPYLEDQPGTINYQVDYFKLMLNLLFNSVNLDQLRMGTIVISKNRSLLLLQDKVFSREVAPLMQAWGAHYNPPAVAACIRDVAFLYGWNYAKIGNRIIDVLKDSFNIRGSRGGLVLTPDKKGKFVSVWQNKANFTGKTVYIFQTCNTGRINDDLMEALQLSYAARKMGAKKIVMVLPFQPYNRQERKAKTREPISAKVVANVLVKSAGVTQVITVDLHAPATQGFFDVPTQHLTAMHQVAMFFKDIIESRGHKKRGSNWIITNMVSGSPDVGRAKVARQFAIEVTGDRYKLAVIDKYRPEAGLAEVATVVGDVKDKDVVLTDDMIDSGGTIKGGARAMKERGARRVYLATVHPVFSDVKVKLFNRDGQRDDEGWQEYEEIKQFLGQHAKTMQEFAPMAKDGKSFTVNALVRLQASPQIDGIVFTDTLKVPPEHIIDRNKVIVSSVAPLLASVCARIINRQSLQDYQYEGETG